MRSLPREIPCLLSRSINTWSFDEDHKPHTGRPRDPVELHATLASSFPSSVLAGCSSAGHFAGDVLLDDEPIVAVVDFERSRLRSASADLRSAQDSFAVGQQLATALDDPDLRGVLVLSDGITCNGSALVSGLLSVLDE